MLQKCISFFAKAVIVAIGALFVAIVAANVPASEVKAHFIPDPPKAQSPERFQPDPAALTSRVDFYLTPYPPTVTAIPPFEVKESGRQTVISRSGKVLLRLDGYKCDQTPTDKGFVSCVGRDTEVHSEIHIGIIASEKMQQEEIPRNGFKGDIASLPVDPN